MSRDAVANVAGPPPAGPFSSAVWAAGLLHVSGVVGQEPETGALVSGDIAAQAEQALANLATVLSAAGKTLDDVVRVGVYLTDMSTFAAINSVYEKHFRSPYPARTSIGVVALPLGAGVEIDAVVG
jgi:2-iminobutanoate/2-iminopropanoate deaminase